MPEGIRKEEAIKPAPLPLPGINPADMPIGTAIHNIQPAALLVAEHQRLALRQIQPHHGFTHTQLFNMRRVFGNNGAVIALFWRFLIRRGFNHITPAARRFFCRRTLF